MAAEVGSGSPSPSPGFPIDSDDVLTEILIRLPAPSSLSRASLVCTRWRRLVTDPYFLRRFRAHHWLGFFRHTFHPAGHGDLSFTPVSGAARRFPVRVRRDERQEKDETAAAGDRDVDVDDYTWEFCGCRHGLVLLVDRRPHGRQGPCQFLVWDPVSGDRRFIAFPPQLSASADPDDLNRFLAQAAVARAAEGPFFTVAVAWNDRGSARVCVYSSETVEWGVDVASAPVRSAGFNASFGNVLVGTNTLCWILLDRRVHVLEFDLASHELAVVGVPRGVYGDHHGLYLSTTLANKGGGGGLTLVAMEPYLRARVWVRAPGAVTGWAPGGTSDVGELLSLRPGAYPFEQPVLGLAGDDNVLFVSTYRGAFMVHLDSMHVEKIRFRCRRGAIHPFSTPLSAPGTRFKNCSLGF